MRRTPSVLTRAVHPRVCGEHAPRRGDRGCGGGFIPACAGNTYMGNRIYLNQYGSSPRVRGTHERDGDHSVVGRFIPACAGNTRAGRRPLRRGTVHPRVCGEHPTSPADVQISAGSSPRVRGTPRTSPPKRRKCRFIPACAGNTGQASVRRRRVDGSSPRVRGTRAAGSTDARARRFIPACAGNTQHQLRHPGDAFGSSPRVRGTRSINCATPAMLSVHPRVCGEHSGKPPSTCTRSGSSPRVRGTLPLDGARQCGERFIPACAGNTP